MKKILIATTNMGKISIYKQICDELGMETTDLRELAINVNVEENGKNELENAIIKAKAYYELTGLPVIANDSGLIIDKFKKEDQPGMLVRRYNNRELTDGEMIQVYIAKLNEVGGQSTGHYNVALALIDENGNIHTMEFYPTRFYINKPSAVVKKGIPLDSLAIDEDTGKYMSEMSTIERNNYEREELQKQKEFIKKVFKDKKI